MASKFRSLSRPVVTAERRIVAERPRRAEMEPPSLARQEPALDHLTQERVAHADEAALVEADEMPLEPDPQCVGDLGLRHLEDRGDEGLVRRADEDRERIDDAPGVVGQVAQPRLEDVAQRAGSSAASPWAIAATSSST